MTNERRQALELAVAVMMFLVGRLVGHPHHQPGDDGRDHVDRGVQGLRDQRQRADRDADREFGRGHAGAGENRDRGDVGLDGLGACHGRRFSRASVNIKAELERAIATHSQERFVANCSDLKRWAASGFRCERSNPFATQRIVIPREGGYPVRRSLSIQSLMPLEYWIVRPVPSRKADDDD